VLFLGIFNYKILNTDLILPIYIETPLGVNFNPRVTLYRDALVACKRDQLTN